MSETDPSIAPDAGAAAADDVGTPPASGRKAAIIVLAGVVGLIVVFLAVALAPKGTPEGGVLPVDPTGYVAPTLAQPALDGSGVISLADYAGKPVVVNFWASWCTTCKQETPVMVAAEKKWRDQGVVFIGVDSVDKDDAARAFEAEYGMQYPSIVDPDGQVAKQWRVTAYPETFFISPDGRISSAVRTGVDAQTLDAGIEALLG